MYEQFKAKAEGVGAEMHRFRTKDDALVFVCDFLRQHGTAHGTNSTAVWAPGTFLGTVDTSGISVAFPGLAFDVSRHSAADAAIGISQADWALADTGTLVVDQTPAEQRLASTLPAIHIALVGIDRILPDKAAVFGRIDPLKSRYLAFITGPSRTADIERVLTIGVHGPKRLVIVMVDEMEGVVR